MQCHGWKCDARGDFTYRTVATEDWNTWKARLAHLARAGGVAVQLLCSEDTLYFSHSGRQYDLWTCDPWEMAWLYKSNLVRGSLSEIGVQAAGDLLEKLLA